MYDLGGGERIRNIWERYYSELHGLVFVVDASDAVHLAMAAKVLSQVVLHPFVQGKAVLILANKQERPGAKTPSEVSALLGLEALNTCCSFTVQSSTLVNSRGGKLDKGFKLGLQWLLTSIKMNLNELEVRVQKDTDEQLDMDRQEREAKRARIRQRKNEQEEQDKEQGDKQSGEADAISMGHPKGAQQVVRLAPLPHAVNDNSSGEQLRKDVYGSQLRPLTTVAQLQPRLDGVSVHSNTSETSSSLSATLVSVRGSQRRRRQRQRSSESLVLDDEDDEDYGHEPAAIKLTGLCCDTLVALYGQPFALEIGSFDYQVTQSSVRAGWDKLKSEMTRKQRFNMDKVARCVHEGWARAVHQIWDEVIYGPRPTALPETGDQGVWPEILFANTQAYDAYFQRKKLALTTYPDLSPSVQLRRLIVAEVLLRQLLHAHPKAIAYPARRSTQQPPVLLAELDTAIASSACP